MEQEINSVELYVAQGRIEADFLAAVFDESGVEVGLREVESSSFPTSGGIMGEIILVVGEDQIPEAKALIKSAQENGQISDKGYYLNS
jgi:hypothetical protein